MFVKNYIRFFAQDNIKKFTSTGGQVWIATEGRSVAQIEGLIKAGHRHFAEKYLQEYLKKYPPLRIKYPQIKVHFFGKLQTNKLKNMLLHFNGLEAVSSKKELDFISKYLPLSPFGSNVNFFIQVNQGNEKQKNGVSEANLDHLLKYASSKNIAIRGLMSIPPKQDDPAIYFSRLRQLANFYQLAECHMGFSNDYEIALASGTSHIRINRVIFEAN